MCPFDSTPRYIRLCSGLVGAKKVILHLYLYNQSLKKKSQTAISLLWRYNSTFVPVITGRHESDLNIDLIEPLLDAPTERNLQTFVHWKPEDLSGLNLPACYIVLQLSACNGAPTPKTWNPENFNKVIKRWKVVNPNDSFVLVGDKGDTKLLSKLSLPKGGVINLLGKTTFNQLCNVLNNSKLVVAHDSGIMHVANALQRPLIALYGPTDITRTAPLAPTSHIIHSRNECSLKMYGFRETEGELASKYTDYYCMSGISVDGVLRKMVETTT